ncbi:hypothetical protein POM88_012204 [Heracleum sosnowskyi]|uniref:Trs120/TRAPPC9 N-terminal domain-containing protein n=1 Tax=Heracleum sosnowskyi TaxID=360622 RepID=A0AAD8IY94_9APIA|nr:hypothetical protein POM88_012204 [Heracleum sosnowskyi]
MQVIKAKKRRLGHAQKTIGDYCLLSGSPVDANAHYSTALELARLTGDYFWYAGALEGSVCALLGDHQRMFSVYISEVLKIHLIQREIKMASIGDFHTCCRSGKPDNYYWNIFYY